MQIHHYKQTCDPGWWVAAFRSPTSDMRVEVLRWCINTYGDSKDRWKQGIKYGEISFAEEKDLALFLLRWSGA